MTRVVNFPRREEGDRETFGAERGGEEERERAMASARKKTILLFDVDGTLTVPRQRASEETLSFLQELRTQRGLTVGIVGGSDYAKICEQLAGEATGGMYDYVFSENGLLAMKSGKEIDRQSLKSHLGEDKLKRFINFVLRYLSDVDCPVKRGTFIEFRNGMLNVSPVGRNCSQEERDAFEAYDKEHNVRTKMVEVLKKEFEDMNLTYSIGGQISFDVRLLRSLYLHIYRESIIWPAVLISHALLRL